MVRKDNQDSYTLDTLPNGIGYAVVCDGMGGANGGKTASLIAVNTFSLSISGLDTNMSKDEILSILDDAVKSANTEIFNKSQTDDELKGMGTTIVACVVVNKTAYIVNVGDSRCYHLQNDNLKRITKDHSAVQELVDQGYLSEKQARNHPNKNIITRALGVDSDVCYDYYCQSIQDGDILLLCTDGITNYVDDLEIPFEIINNAESVPNRLISLANSRGGADNSTVVLIKF